MEARVRPRQLWPVARASGERARRTALLAFIAERGNLVIGSSPAPPPTAERESGAGGSASRERVQPFLALRSARDSSATRRR